MRQLSISMSMRMDEDGVAGFFEDLPVLIIVLAGVSLLVSTSVITSERFSEQRLHSNLDAAAERLLDNLLVSLGFGKERTVLVSSVCTLNISRCSAEALENEQYAISFLQHYPSLQWLQKKVSSSEVPAESTGHASCLFNARQDFGLSSIVSVTVLVWH